MSKPRRRTINVCRKHGPVPVYWQSDQRGPRCSHYLRTKRPCGLPAPRVEVIEAAPVEAERLRGLLMEAAHYLESCGCDDEECPGRQKAAQIRETLEVDHAE